MVEKNIFMNPSSGNSFSLLQRLPFPRGQHEDRKRRGDHEEASASSVRRQKIEQLSPRAAGARVRTGEFPITATRRTFFKSGKEEKDAPSTDSEPIHRFREVKEGFLSHEKVGNPLFSRESREWISSRGK